MHLAHASNSSRQAPESCRTEDEDVAASVAAAFREADMVVRENFGAIESFEKTATGVRMNFCKEGKRQSAEAALAVVAAGWAADTAGLNLAAAGVASDHRGFVKVDEYLQTSAPIISSPPETSPAASCLSHPRYRRASWRPQTPC